MSYDYFLFARPADGGAPTFESLAAGMRPIGTPAELMARVEAIFPDVRWEALHDDVGAWFGASRPEFLISPDADGRVSAVKVAYIDPAEIRALAAALDLVVFDPQKGVLFSG